MCRSVSWDTALWELKELSISKPSFRAEDIWRYFLVYLKSYKTTKKRNLCKNRFIKLNTFFSILSQLSHNIVVSHMK